MTPIETALWFNYLGFLILIVLAVMNRISINRLNKKPRKTLRYKLGDMEFEESIDFNPSEKRDEDNDPATG